MKIKKIIALILLGTILLSCCSCTALDRLKEEHVRYSKTSEDILEYCGNQYFALDIESKKHFGDCEGTIYGVVTNYDVPLLLSQFNYNYFARASARISHQKTMIMISHESNRCYLRKDIYDRYKTMTFDEFFSGYSFHSYMNYKNRFVSKESVAAIREITNGPTMKDGNLQNHACVGTLNLCDAEQTVLFFEYSVFRSDKGEYFMESLNNSRYEVPEKYRPLFDEFCR